MLFAEGVYIRRYLRSIEENSIMPFLTLQESEMNSSIQKMCFESTDKAFKEYLAKFDMEVILPILRKESRIITNRAVRIYNDLIFAGLIRGALPSGYVENYRFYQNPR
jgi:glutamate/tyrosine decarboxylase-like PLP-dependent enzyme